MDYIIINFFKDKVNDILFVCVSRDRYKYDTDKTMHLIKAIDTNGTLMGIIDWFAVHGTSMNNTNKLISSDNKGYAAMRYEEDYNGRLHIGKVSAIVLSVQVCHVASLLL